MRTPLPGQSARRTEQTLCPLAQRSRPLLTLFFLLLAASSPHASAAARIEGIVRTSEGSPLDNVNVALEKLARGTQTAASGHFSLDNVPAGTHTLTLTHVGYQTLRREVAVRAGETVSLSLILTGRPAEIPEVVVTGTRSPRELERTPVQTTVVAQQEIVRQGAVRLSDLLAEQTGLQLTYDHGTGPQTPDPTTPSFASYTLQPRFTYQIGDRAELNVGTRFFREDQRSTAAIRVAAADERADEKASLSEWSLAPAIAFRTAPGHRWMASLYTSRYENTRSLTRQDNRLYSASDFSQAYHKAELQFDALPGAAHRLPPTRAPAEKSRTEA